MRRTQFCFSRRRVRLTVTVTIVVTFNPFRRRTVGSCRCSQCIRTAGHQAYDSFFVPHVGLHCSLFGYYGYSRGHPAGNCNRNCNCNRLLSPDKPRSGNWLSSGNNCTGSGLRSSELTVSLVSRVRGSMTVCLVSPVIDIEMSTAGVAVVRLLSCSSWFALTVSGLPTVSPIVDPSNDPLTCPLMLPGILLSSLQLLSTVPFHGICPRFFPRFLSTDTIYGDLSSSGAHPSYPSGLHVYLIKR